MTTFEPPVFQWERTKARCQDLGLPFDDDFANRAEIFCRENAVDPATADAAGVLYSGQIWRAFNPRSYSRWGRVKLAWHFLFGRMEGR